ncbi:MAG: FlgD immunoglobulin-like domain containing protein [Bacteroidota bacterium]
MDGITGISGDSAASLGALNQTGEVLGQEDFLLLLVTQLSNQDPLNPMDGQEFAAQLAQFSSLEQLITIGDTLDQSNAVNGLLAQSMNSGVAAGLIGKEVEAEGVDLFVSEGKPSDISYELGEAAASVTLDIKNEAGQVIRTIDVGSRGKGEHAFSWDGKDADGNEVANGKYSVELHAQDTAGNDVSSRTFMKGIVDKITFGPEGILVWVGQSSIALGNVRSVGGTE